MPRTLIHYEEPYVCCKGCETEPCQDCGKQLCPTSGHREGTDEHGGWHCWKCSRVRDQEKKLTVTDDRRAALKRFWKSRADRQWSGKEIRQVERVFIDDKWPSSLSPYDPLAEIIREEMANDSVAADERMTIINRRAHQALDEWLVELAKAKES